ncbi:hypothetical protein DLAC_09738 [Tieghemostelium lacteum]|uniref:Uncharacterized protein n=1 Tax=Tieghemostelium lacteum TaxID=361077 RepID=A0A151Z731_TIELA|nr:hypothetical protein DLAC_09738 [Tieghemostelium lacteum]|eukprot:KYQ89769.1 hypothetical protein DLAC_09738 [Tieghemostelium lacteum]
MDNMEIDNNNNNSNNSKNCSQYKYNRFFCFSLFKKILGYLWKDKYVSRRWKVSLSLVCWPFHCYISDFVSNQLDLEMEMCGDKDIMIQNHWNTKYSLYKQPPRYFNFSLDVYNILFKPCKQRLLQQCTSTMNDCNNSIHLSNQCTKTIIQKNIGFFSRLEKLQIEFPDSNNQCVSDFHHILTVCHPLRELIILFYGICEFPIFESMSRHIETLNRLSLLYLEIDDCKLCGFKQLLESGNSKIEYLHMESTSLNLYSTVLDAIYCGRLRNLKTLVLIYDDAGFFIRIPPESLFKGLLELPNLTDFCISASALIEHGFDIQWMIYYLKREQSLKRLTIDFISNCLEYIIVQPLIECVLQEKHYLEKLSLTTPILTNVTAKSLQSLKLDLDNKRQYTDLEIKVLADMLLKDRSNLKKLSLNSFGTTTNRLVAQLLSSNKSITKLKTNIYKCHFNVILEALKRNTILQTLCLTSDSCGEINQDLIQQVLYHLEYHPSIEKLVFESKCKFNFTNLSRQFNYYHNPDLSRYSCFKIK